MGAGLLKQWMRWESVLALIACAPLLARAGELADYPTSMRDRPLVLPASIAQITASVDVDYEDAAFDPPGDTHRAATPHVNVGAAAAVGLPGAVELEIRGAVGVDVFFPNVAVHNADGAFAARLRVGARAEGGFDLAWDVRLDEGGYGTSRLSIGMPARLRFGESWFIRTGDNLLSVPIGADPLGAGVRWALPLSIGYQFAPRLGATLGAPLIRVMGRDPVRLLVADMLEGTLTVLYSPRPSFDLAAVVTGGYMDGAPHSGVLTFYRGAFALTASYRF